MPFNSFSDWWQAVHNGWNNFWSSIGQNAQSYYDQSQVGNNATSALGMGIANGDTTVDEASGQVIDALTQAPGTSAQSAGSYDLSGILGSSAYASSPSLQAYYEMFQKTGNEAYLEKLIDNAYQLENAASARDYEKMMSDTGFSRLVADIEKSGFNPWLALQGSMSSASAGSGIMAGRSSVSATSQENSVSNNRRNNNAEIAGNVIRALVMLAVLALK